MREYFLKAGDPDACQISLATSCTSVALLPKTLWLQAKNTKSRKETAQRRGATSMNCPSTASAIRQQPCYMTPVFPLLLCKPLWGTIPGKSMKDTSTLEPRSLHKPLKNYQICDHSSFFMICWGVGLFGSSSYLVSPAVHLNEMRPSLPKRFLPMIHCASVGACFSGLCIQGR